MIPVMMVNRFFCGIGLATLLLATGFASATNIITGAGATFPFLIYTSWANAYEKQTGIKVNYYPIGSSGGVEKVLSKAVDFGATDIPLIQKELKKNGLVQFPTFIGGVVPAINLNGIAEGQLKLSGKVLADIFLGKITKWDDERIAADNNGVKLPDIKISVIYRIDGSGTTHNFTSYLSQVSPAWKSSMGAGNTVAWKVGTSVIGTDGMISYLKNVSGSIGYLEHAITVQEKINYAQMKNRDGNFVKPSPATFIAASIGIETSQCFCEPMINKPGKDTWPITIATYILMHKSMSSRKVIKFFDWAFGKGDKMASDLGYTQPPKEAQKWIINFSWNQIMEEKAVKP